MVDQAAFTVNVPSDARELTWELRANGPLVSPTWPSAMRAASTCSGPRVGICALTRTGRSADASWIASW